jgi:hypothetical protein
MGVDTNIHIGPYMIVSGELKISVDREIKTCPNEDCEIHKSNISFQPSQNFCLKCGYGTGSKVLQENKEIIPHDLMNGKTIDGVKYKVDWDDLAFTDGNYGNGKDGVIISNHISPFGKRHPEDVSDVDLTNVKIQDEIDWFKNEFDEDIKTFEKVFGEGSVSIKWGVIQWYS